MDRVQELVAAIAALRPAEKRRLFQLLSQQGIVDGAAEQPPHPPQLELLSPGAKGDRSPDYLLIFDGGSRGNPGLGYGSYAIVRVQDGAQRLERLKLGDGYTNNEAEYDALIAGLRDLIGRIEEAGRQPQEFALEVRGDSMLVIRQLEGRWKAKDPRMRERRDRCQSLLRRFAVATLKAQPREESVRVLGH